MTPFWQNKNGRIKEASKWKRPGARFEKAKADRAVEFIEESCRHYKGEFEGQLFKLNIWQREIVRGIFGWIRLSDDTRLFREIYIEVPKKNGKSTLGAALGLCILYTDGEPGAEIYSAAAETEQAGIIFNTAKMMVEQEQDLKDVSEIFRRSIVYKTSSYIVLSADADTKEGKNSHAVLFDELHVQPNRELYDNLKTGMAARRQPLMIMFTTAGFDRTSICWEKHEKAESSMLGTLNDPSFLGIIFAADETDDWKSPKTWKKANPNYGVSVKVSFLEEECREAQRVPAYENTFKRKHLNIWTEQETRWMPMDLWDACGKAPVIRDDFKGKRCFAGLDLSSTDDLTALAFTFPPERMPLYGIDESKVKPNDRDFGYLQEMDQSIRVLMMFWIPEENIRDRSHAHRVNYEAWRDQGLIETTPGNTIDYRYIIAALDHAKDEFDLKGVLCDPWGHRYISNELQDNHGFTVDENEWKLGYSRRPYFGLFAQNYNTYTPALNALMTLVKLGLLAHGNHPVLRLHASNFMVKEGAFGGFVPMEKKRNRNKYDGFSALTFAVDLAIRNANQTGRSVYDDRGLRSL